MTGYGIACKETETGNFSPAYLLFGEEAFLKDELTAMIGKAFLGPQSLYGREKVDGTACSLEEVVARLSESNIFSEQRLLLVDNPPYLASTEKAGAPGKKDKPPREDSSTERLEQFLAQEGARDRPEKIIIFRAQAVDRRRRLFKLLQEKGTVVECAPLKGGDLAAWITRRVALAGKRIERAAVERLLVSGDGDLYSIANELDKYITYLREDEDTITAAVIEILFSGDNQGNVFKLADALAEGKPEQALQLLRLLLGKREEPVFIFFMLVRHFRLLLASRSLLDGKVPPGRHAAILKVKPFVSTRLSRQAASYRPETLEEIIILLREMDRRIKTGLIEPRQALEIIVVQIHHFYRSTRKNHSQQ